MREPTYKCPQYAWFYNSATKTGEIQAEPGVVTPGAVTIAIADGEALAFDTADPANRGPLLKHHFDNLQRKRAARGR